MSGGGQNPRFPVGNVRDGQPDRGGSIKVGSVARVGAGGVLPAAADEGDRVPILVDQFGRVVVVTSVKPLAVEHDTWIRANANGAASLVVKASAGRLRYVAGSNAHFLEARYLMVFNATSLPANGTAPVYVWKAPADSTVHKHLPEIGDYFDTGIVIAWSSTIHTLTLGTAGDHNITALYF